MNKVNLFLHIGLPKTGSTAIQQLLSINSKSLAKYGFSYPDTGRVGAAHYEFAWSLNPGHPRYGELSPMAGKLWESLAQEVSSKKASQVILSSEAFTNARELEKLRQFTERYDIQIIVYLRRQDHRLQSGYQQLIKGPGCFGHSIQEYIQGRLASGKDNYATKLDRWGEVFGKDRLIVRAYEQEQLPRGLLANFMETIGLVLSDDFTLPGRQNTSLNRDAVEFLRLCNAYPLGEPIRAKLLRALKDFCTQLDNGPESDSSWISPRQRIDILKHYEPSNSYVARKYLSRDDGRLFYEPWPNSNDPWSPYSGLPVETAMQIFAAYWVAHKQPD